MEEFKGTPGPWIVDLGKKRAAISGNRWDQFAKVVIKINSEKELNPQGLANAHLIASAPELLSALQELVHFHMCELESLSSGQPSPEDWLNAVSKAENIIKKALS